MAPPLSSDLSSAPITTDDTLAESRSAELTSESGTALGQSLNPIITDDIVVVGTSTMRDGGAPSAGGISTQQGFYISDTPSSEEQADSLRLIKPQDDQISQQLRPYHQLLLWSLCPRSRLVCKALQDVLLLQSSLHKIRLVPLK